MDCKAAREATSALLDGEASDLERSSLDAHLASCPACRSWREEAHELTRRVRLVSASPVHLPAASLIGAIREAERRRRWWRSLALTRAALALVAVGQLVVTIPPLLFGTDHNAPMHVAHELGAFDMALAVGFLVAALRPSRAQGMRALVGCAALLLALTAVIDLIVGRTTASDELPHLLAIGGWLLMRRIAALTPQGADEPPLSLSASVRSLASAVRPGTGATATGDLALGPDRWRAETAPCNEIPEVLEAPARRVAGVG